MEETGEAGGAGLVTAGLVVIGDEVLSGRTKDQNIGHIAEKLTEAGVQLREVRIVADQQDAIVEAVNTLRSRYDHVFTTGGIGPTHDDITADAIASAFDLPIEQNQQAVEIMHQYFREDQLTPARMRMTRMPVGAELIDNPVSATPGFSIGNVYVMAGVPKIMQSMLEGVLPRLRTGIRILSRTVRVFSKEGDVANLLADLQVRFPHVAIGSYPFYVDTVFGTHVVMRATSPESLEQTEQALWEGLAARNIKADRPEQGETA